MSDDEFFEMLWNTYPRDLCRKKPGSKKVARQSFDKLKADDALKDKIMIGLREWMRACRQEAKTGTTDRWPFLSTWLNQARYELDEIPQSEDLRTVLCRVCNKAPVQVNHYCWPCFEKRQEPNWRDRLVDICVSHGTEKGIASLHKKYPRLKIENGSVVHC